MVLGVVQFEHFRRSYRKSNVIEGNKAELKVKYETAKSLGAKLQATKAQVLSFKGEFEAVQRKQAAAMVANSTTVADAELEAKSSALRS